MEQSNSRRGLRALAAFAATILACACAAAPPAAPTATQSPAAQSILRSSSPAAGSTVDGPIDQLRLRFSPPARLEELTVTGSDGLQMPMMITAVGEVADYSLPLPDLGPGAYTVQWRASAAGAAHRGSFRFTVR